MGLYVNPWDMWDYHKGLWVDKIEKNPPARRASTAPDSDDDVRSRKVQVMFVNNSQGCQMAKCDPSAIARGQGVKK